MPGPVSAHRPWYLVSSFPFNVLHSWYQLDRSGIPIKPIGLSDRRVGLLNATNEKNTRLGTEKPIAVLRGGG
jgi:hypothetical protein